jgi:hypothetical protein
MERQIILHKRSEESGKIPRAEDLEFGEIAINYADESIFIKNNSGEIVEFLSLKRIQQLINEAIGNIDGGIIGSGTTTPEMPSEPDPTPDVELGEINEGNSISINEENLSAGTYTLKYIDANDNAIENFRPITTFIID